MINIAPNSSPHTRVNTAVADIMRSVIVALLPATLMGIYAFGWCAFNLLIISLVSSLAFEYGCLKLAEKDPLPILRDNSALLTGWLVAMTLPPSAPWWLAVVGAGMAIILGKQVYGGLGQNLFNPAMLTRVALLISFPVEMTTWANVNPLFSENSASFTEALSITFGGSKAIDANTGATVLGYVKTEFSLQHYLPDTLKGYYQTADALIGLRRGSLGETSSLLILLGGGYLLYKKVITWHIPVALLLTITVLSSLFYLIDSSRYLSPLVHLTSGAVMLTAFFLATDYVTSPNTPIGQLIFGVGCGLLIFVIRSWGGYPEGTGFAILLMNSVTPLIDHYIRPRIVGRDRKGRPLESGK